MTWRSTLLAVALLAGAKAANESDPSFPPPTPCPLEMQTILMDTADNMYQKYRLPIAMGYSGPDGKGGQCSMGFVLHPNLTTSQNETLSSPTPSKMRPIPRQSPRDDFLYGSFTKTWTASAILKAHNERKLSIDEPAWKYLEPAFQKATNGDSLMNYYADANESIKQVTIRQILIMRGNFGDFDEISVQEQHPKKDLSPSDIVQGRFSDMDNSYPLDSCGYYSSLGYTLLGLLLNGLADQSWDQYDQNVWRDMFPRIRFGVHGSCSTYTDVRGTCDSCSPHSPSDMSCTGGYSCGNLIGPPEEVARFAHALFSGALLGQETTTMMLRGESILPGAENSAGPQPLGAEGARSGNPCNKGFDPGDLYGMGVEMHKDTRLPGHEGVTYGFTSDTYYDMNRKAAYVAGIATSSEGMDGKAWDCWNSLHDALHVENSNVIAV